MVQHYIVTTLPLRDTKSNRDLCDMPALYNKQFDTVQEGWQSQQQTGSIQ